jgi:4'-phosphopantetheinyl transferase EntD
MMPAAEILLLPWKSPPDTTVLRIDAVDASPNSIQDILSENERTLFQNLIGKKRKHSFVAGRMAAKQCVSRLIGISKFESIDFCDIDIGRTVGGALFLRVRGIPRPDVSLSISHGGEFAFAGAITAERIGIDVEPVNEKCVSLKDAFAVSSEVQILKEASENDADAALQFTRLFSAKESAAKCLGTHMYFAFHHYRLVFADKDALVLEDLSDNKMRHSVQTCIKNNHVFSRVLCPASH